MSRRSESAYTLVELLVVILVIFILASIAYPTYTSVTGRARITQDINNLRQIGLAMQTYLNDHDQVVPASPTWPGTSTTPVLYPKYLGTRKVLQSPFDKRLSSEAADGTPPVSYAVNNNIYTNVAGNMAAIKSASSTIFMAPNYTGDPSALASWTGTAGNAAAISPAGGNGTLGPQSNGQQINALFCDLHVETMTFGPQGNPTTGSFKDTTSNPLGVKHWDPTQ